MNMHQCYTQLIEEFMCTRASEFRTNDVKMYIMDKCADNRKRNIPTTMEVAQYLRKIGCESIRKGVYSPRTEVRT